MADRASNRSKQKHQKSFIRKYDVVYHEKPIITLKEAKKFFTKKELELLKDDDLMRIIGKMEQISNMLFGISLVPQNTDNVL